MNIVIFTSLNIIYFVLSNAINHKYRLNLDLNKLALRYIVFKEKRMGKLIKNIVNKLEIYHNKSIVSVADGIMSYNELSENEKTLIETVISLSY